MKMNRIINIKNGVAEIEWRVGSEYALAEVGEGAKVGDAVAEHDLVYNGGDKRYDELWQRFIKE